MKNLVAFIKFNMQMQKRKSKELAQALYVDTGYFSRIINQKIKPKNDEIYQKLSQLLHLDWDIITEQNDKLDNLFAEYLDAVYFADNNQRNSLYQMINISKTQCANSPYLFDVMMTSFIQGTISKKYSDEYNSVLVQLLDIYQYFDPNYKQIFLVFYLRYLNDHQKFHAIKTIIEQLDGQKFYDEKLEMMFKYYYFSYLNFDHSTIKSYEIYQSCLKLCKKYNNTKREFYLQMMLASQLTTNKEYQEAIELNLHLLSQLEKDNINCGNILNNIAWTYSLMKDHKNALKYYIMCTAYSDENDLYFNLAWTYFQLGDRKNASKYVEIGQTSKCRLDYFYDLLNWLQAMLNKAYSLKAHEILEDIWKQHHADMSIDMQNFVLIELMNSCWKNKLYDQYHDISKQIINKNSQCMNVIIDD